MTVPKIKRLHCLAALTAALTCSQNELIYAQEESGGLGIEGPSELFHWKMFNLHPRLATSLTYDDNINLRKTNALQDITWIVAPGISAVAGDPSSGFSKLFSVDYGASILTFLKHDEFSAVDHSAKIAGLLPFAKLTLGVSAGFQKLSTPEVELGIRVQRQLYTAAATSRYEISPKTSVEVNGGYNKTEYNDKRLIGSDELSNQNWINNQVSSKVNLGLGLGAGILTQDRGPKQTYERALLRAIYVLTGKLDLTASAGVEWRQYKSFNHLERLVIISPTNITFTTTNISEKAASRVSPIFDIGANYRPREGTTLRLDLFRRDQNSPTLAGYNYISTGINVSLQQRFWERFSATFGGTFENSSYHAELKNQNLNREDYYYAVNAGLDALITQRWVAGVVIQHRSSDSSEKNGTIFDNNQVVLQTSYSF